MHRKRIKVRKGYKLDCKIHKVGGHSVLVCPLIFLYTTATQKKSFVPVEALGKTLWEKWRLT